MLNIVPPDCKVEHCPQLHRIIKLLYTVPSYIKWLRWTIFSHIHEHIEHSP